MSIHSNSRQALTQLKNGHLLTDARWDAYRGLLDLGPSTANELHAWVSDDHRNNMGARLIELEHMGLVVRGPSRRCKITGRPCLTWSAVMPPPTEIQELVTMTPRYRRQSLGSRARDLELEVQELRRKCLALSKLQGLD